MNNLSYRIHYTQAQWIDPPPVRHGGGSNVVFADSHTAYWNWVSPDTIAAGEKLQMNFNPTAPDARKDAKNMVEGVWGKKGWTGFP